MVKGQLGDSPIRPKGVSSPASWMTTLHSWVPGGRSCEAVTLVSVVVSG